MAEKLGIGDLTIGIDVNGVNRYIENLNLVAITKAQEQVKNGIHYVINKIDEGWQGKAALNYKARLEIAQRYLYSCLDSVKKILNAQLKELESNYIRQDQKIVSEVISKQNYDDLNII